MNTQSTTPPEESPLRDVAIFTKSVEKVFRKLIRIVLGKMTVKKLNELIRFIFVEEAERQLLVERPGKNVPLSKLALLTGLDSRTLIAIRSKSQYSRPFHEQSRFLREILPESNVLDNWSSNHRYTEEKSGKPATLKIRGEYPSFESLVSESNTVRGVTWQSVLKRLLSSESVNYDKQKQTVSLLNVKHIPNSAKGYVAAIEVGLAAVCYLLDTLSNNISQSPGSNQKFFQRSSWTSRLDQSDAESFRTELKALLEYQEDCIRSLIQSYEQEDSTPSQITAGYSAFYFEENPTRAIS